MINYHINYSIKELIQLFTLLGWNLKMFWVVFRSLELSFLSVDLPLGQINFVANHNFDCVWHLMLFKHVVPDFEIVKGWFFANIVYHNCAIGIFHIVRDETSKPFLTSSVPKLNSILVTIASNIFNMKIDAYRRLNRDLDTLGPY